MTPLLRAVVLMTVCSVGPASGASPCSELCQADFYVSATAESVQELIDGGVDVNSVDDMGKSALHWTAAADPKVISTLLAAGADPKAADTLDRTPLHFVSATGSAENIRLLLDAGADVNGKTANDWTPVHGAAKFGSPDQVMILLDAGADVAARTEMGESAFQFALGNPKFADSEALERLEAGK